MGELVRGAGAVAQDQKVSRCRGWPLLLPWRDAHTLCLPNSCSQPDPSPCACKSKTWAVLEGPGENRWQVSPPPSPAKPPGLENDNRRSVAAPSAAYVWRAKVKS